MKTQILVALLAGVLASGPCNAGVKVGQITSTIFG
jgi:hypothetical protein